MFHYRFCAYIFRLAIPKIIQIDLRIPRIAVTAFVSKFHAVYRDSWAEVDAARIHAEELFFIFLRGTAVPECCFCFLSECDKRFGIHFRKEIHHNAAGAEIG